MTSTRASPRPSPGSWTAAGELEHRDVARRRGALVIADRLGVAIPEKAERATPPAPNGARGEQRAGVAITGRDLNDRSAHIDIPRRRGVLAVADVIGVAIAELANIS